MENKQDSGNFHLLVKESLANEPVVLLQVTPENIERLNDTLSDLSTRAGMLPMTGNPSETNQQWMENARSLWVFGQRGADFANPDNAIGFVNVYAPEPAHVEQINKWVPKRFKGAYTQDSLVEISSFAKGLPETASADLSANRQALAKIFYFEGKKNYPKVDGAVVWITHNDENMLDPFEAEQVVKLGGKALGSMKYHVDEKVDSSCFLIPKVAFMNKLTGQESRFKSAPPKPAV